MSQNSSSIDDYGNITGDPSIDALILDGSTDSSGMPVSDGTAPAPAVVTMNDPSPASTPSVNGTSFLGSIESLSSKVISKAESGVKTVYGGVKTVASDVTGGAEHLVSDVTGTVTTPIILLGIVLVVGLVYIAYSGNVKVSA